MTKPLLVGLTGGIGSGKTVVSKIFLTLSIPVYYADDRAKWLMVNDHDLVSQVKEAFGEQSYHQEGQLNRGYLADRVFKNEQELSRLNGLVHPAVGRDFEYWVAKHSSAPYVLKEAALIYESGSYKRLDKVIAVAASREERIKRVLLRDLQRDRQQVLDIMEKQLSENERKKRADFVIENDGRKLVIPQVLAIDKLLRSM